jgi:hypothetical protein
VAALLAWRLSEATADAREPPSRPAAAATLTISVTNPTATGQKNVVPQADPATLRFSVPPSPGAYGYLAGPGMPNPRH